MAKRSPAIPLSPMVGGINMFEREATSTQTSDAIDVVVDDGDLRRRPAFKAVASAPPFIFTRSRCRVATVNLTSGSPATPALYEDRNLAITAGMVGGEANSGLLLVGSDEQFDGIDWRHVTLSGSAPPGTRLFLRPQFVIADALGSSSSFADIRHFVDTTALHDSTQDSTNMCESWNTLHRDGRISWHRSEYEDNTTWPLVTLTGAANTPTYWVALNFVATPPSEYDSSATFVAGPSSITLTINRPGISCFKLERVSGIYPVRGKKGSTTFVMSDRLKARGQEKGAQIGRINSSIRETEIVHLVRDYGAGSLDVITNADWSGGSTWNEGTDDLLTKLNDAYDWLPSFQDGAGTPGDPHEDYDGQWGGDTIRNDITDTSGSPDEIAFTVSGETVFEDEYEFCVVECTARSGAGPALRERRRIHYNTVSGTTVTCSVYPDWSASPDSNNRFRIIGKPFSVRLGKDRQSADTAWPLYDFDLEIITNAEQTLTLRSSDLISFDDVFDMDALSTDYFQNWVHWTIGRECRWDIPAADSWDHTFNTTTKEHILTNGNHKLLRYEGGRLEFLTATSDPNNARATEILGILPDPDGRHSSLYTLALTGGQLRKDPPSGKFVRDYQGHIVVAGIQGDPYRIQWSLPSIYNDIWPTVYEAQVRDSNNDPITGMATLGNELVVYTATAIHSTGPADDNGMLYFAPKTQGIGFVSHHSVKEIPIGTSHALIGCTGDGVYAYNGAEPVPVIDDWKRVIKGGVNKRRLHRSVAGVSKHENCYYLAVPSANSWVNDRLIRYNYVDRTTYVYSFPYDGCSFISVDYATDGRETVLFGTEDGHICIFADAPTDDGFTITGRAKTPPVQIDGSTLRLTGHMITAGDTGASGSLTVRTVVNGRQPAIQTYSNDFDAGSAELGTFTLGTDVVDDMRLKTRKINLPAGTKAESWQVEVEGTGRWRLRSLESLVTRAGQRSRR